MYVQTFIPSITPNRWALTNFYVNHMNDRFMWLDRTFITLLRIITHLAMEWVLNGFRWVSMGSMGFRWVSMGFRWVRWVSMGFDGFRWVSMGLATSLVKNLLFFTVSLTLTESFSVSVWKSSTKQMLTVLVHFVRRKRMCVAPVLAWRKNTLSCWSF